MRGGQHEFKGTLEVWPVRPHAQQPGDL